MQKFKDVAHLYEAFEGESGTYQEIGRKRDAQQSKTRWPLISSLGEWTQATEVPSVHMRQPEDAELTDSAFQTLAEQRTETARTMTATLGRAEPNPLSRLSMSGLQMQDESPLSLFAQVGLAKSEEPRSSFGLKQLFDRIAGNRRI